MLATQKLCIDFNTEYLVFLPPHVGLIITCLDDSDVKPKPITTQSWINHAAPRIAIKKTPGQFSRRQTKIRRSRSLTNPKGVWMDIVTLTICTVQEYFMFSVVIRAAAAEANRIQEFLFHFK